MTSNGGLWKLLQLGDSFFPTGAMAHSFGVEGLWSEGALRDASELERFVEGQLQQRWATTDRPAILAAHAARGDLGEVERVDRWVDRSSPVAAWREAGRRLGRALLRTHERLGTPGACEYGERVRSLECPGQGCVVQGLLTEASGLDAESAALLSAYTLAVAIVGAALRLGIVGHLDAQRILNRQQARTAAIFEEPPPDLTDAHAWAPHAEVAAMRHAARPGRLFAS